jgi:hypothetical protein
VSNAPEADFPEPIRNSERFQRLTRIADPAIWPDSLSAAIRSGAYVFWRHHDQWVILMSMTKGDRISTMGGGHVQARLAVNLVTGEVQRSPSGMRIGEWEAGVLGETEEFRQRDARLKQRRGGSIRGEHGWNELGQERGRPKTEG